MASRSREDSLSRRRERDRLRRQLELLKKEMHGLNHAEINCACY